MSEQMKSGEIVAVIPQSDVSPMIAMIERVAMDPSASIEKLERMMDMRDRLQSEAAKMAFAGAFAAASAEFPSIPLNGKGDKNKPYALLKDIINCTRPVLSRYGLALSFGVVSNANGVTVTAELMHVQGHSKTTSMELPKDQSGSKNAVQAVGSSQTYGQRYTAQAILGLSLGDDTDDDGQAAAIKTATISADEFFQIRNLIEEAGADEAKFCEYLRVASLEAMPQRMFADAVSALRKKIKAKVAA
jgi:ERF superfamily